MSLGLSSVYAEQIQECQKTQRENKHLLLLQGALQTSLRGGTETYETQLHKKKCDFVKIKRSLSDSLATQIFNDRGIFAETDACGWRFIV